MTLIGVVGGNGQVGTELCLRLRHAPDCRVVAIVRNPSGSAFLRQQGVECRHGRIADELEAADVIGDFDVLFNLTLSKTGNPRLDREIDRRISRNVVLFSKPACQVVLASTMMVYAPDRSWRFPDSYGIGKMLEEYYSARLCRRTRRAFYAVRLGHVLGDLQAISRHIRESIERGHVRLRDGGIQASNTIFAASVAEALLNIAQGKEIPGTYDLISFPQWTWRDVFVFHAQKMGRHLDIVAEKDIRSRRTILAPSPTLRNLCNYLSNAPFFRPRLLFVLGLLPRNMNLKMQMRYYQARALREIAQLEEKTNVWEVPYWREVAPHPLRSLGRPEDADKCLPLCIASTATLA